MKTKDEVLKMLKSMAGCYTAVFCKDEKGNNAMYTACNVDYFFILDYEECLIEDENWVLNEFKNLNSGDINIDEWAQDLSREEIEALKNTMDAGKLFIASFQNNKVGYMDIIIWEN